MATKEDNIVYLSSDDDNDYYLEGSNRSAHLDESESVNGSIDHQHTSIATAKSMNNTGISNNGYLSPMQGFDRILYSDGEKRRRLDSLSLNNNPFRSTSPKKIKSLSNESGFNLSNSPKLPLSKWSEETGNIYISDKHGDISSWQSQLPEIKNQSSSGQNNLVIQNSEDQQLNFQNKRDNVASPTSSNSKDSNGINSPIEILSISDDDDINIEKDNTNDFGSDDEIMILDAEEATRSGKFKESSFEKQSKLANSLTQYLHGPDRTNNINRSDNQALAVQRNGSFQPNNQISPRQVTPHSLVPSNDEIESQYLGPSKYFNKPVPVPQISDPGFSADDLRQKELHQRLENYKVEQSVLSSSYIKALGEKDKYLDMLRSISEVISNLRTQAESYKNRTDNVSIGMYNSITSILSDKNGELQRIKNEFSRAKSIYDAFASRLNRINEAISSLHMSDTFIQIPINRHMSMGYTANIYSEDTDHEHLQNLLDNIRPDEDLGDGLENTPSELSINLMKYQRMGLSWLLRMESSKSKGGILADDMGLGKTIQAIALIIANKSKNSDQKTTLVVAPVSLLRQWVAEIESKVKPNASFRVGIFHGIEKKNLSTFKSFKEYDVIMTSYGTLSSEWKKHFKEALDEAMINKNRNVLPDLNSGGKSYNSPFYSEDAKFYRIILDEAQNIKNKLAINSKAVACLKGEYRLCLSGTPIQNNVEELYPIIRFLKIKPYNNEYKFRSDIVLPLRSKSGSYDDFDRKTSMKKLRAILKAILLRRSKNSLVDGKPILTLPEKHILLDNVHVDKEEREFYLSLESGIQRKAKRLLAEKRVGAASNILTLLLRLRQACCHRFLVELGEIKEQEQEATSCFNPRNWKLIFDKVKEFDEETIARIKSNLEQPVDDTNGGMFSCPLCFDVYAYESVVLFPGCGHMICNNCIDDFFTNNDVGEGSEDKRIASCYQCSMIIREADLINYPMFDKIINDNLDYQELAEYYKKHHLPSRIRNDVRINQLIRENSGFTPSAKIKKCVQILNEIFIKYPNEKVIIFSQFTSLFDLIKLVLDEANISFLRYDGSMSVDDKNTTIRKFYQENTKVLLLSLRSGNVGLTLTCASHVIIMDPFWNPYVEEQAMDRTYRIGQEREVYVHRILIEGTIESRIMELQEMKKEMVGAALDESSMKSVSRLGQRELGFLFGLNSLR